MVCVDFDLRFLGFRCLRFLGLFVVIGLRFALFPFVLLVWCLSLNLVGILVCFVAVYCVGCLIGGLLTFGWVWWFVCFRGRWFPLLGWVLCW